MDVTLDALCADLQSCFDPPNTETSAVKASKLVEAQVASAFVVWSHQLLSFTSYLVIVLVQVEEIVMNELEILATEVIQEAQVNIIALVLL